MCVCVCVRVICVCVCASERVFMSILIIYIYTSMCVTNLSELCIYDDTNLTKYASCLFTIHYEYRELLNKLDLTGIKVLYETIHAGETIFIWMGCSFIMIFMMSCICEVLSHEWIVWGISQLWYSNYIMWTLACKWIDGWVYGQVDGWMNEWIDEWMDRWMDGWMEG